MFFLSHSIYEQNTETVPYRVRDPVYKNIRMSEFNIDVIHFLDKVIISYFHSVS